MEVSGVTGNNLRPLIHLTQPRTSEPKGPSQDDLMATSSNAVTDGRVPESDTQPGKSQSSLGVSGSERAGTRLRKDQMTDRIITQVIDHNQEVIRQIPPDELLNIMHHVRALQGMLFDVKV